MTGLYQKFIITKADGTPVAPEAEYFVMRLDTDPHARIAMRAYALSCVRENSELSEDILRSLERLSKPTMCPICGKAYLERKVNRFGGYDYIHTIAGSFREICTQSRASVLTNTQCFEGE